jgi:endonuclease/exonuclease/phosphatase family metal-dependent hydrolase
MPYGTPPPATAAGLLELRKRIAQAAIPSSRLDESLNVATWNLREFGKKPRLEPSIYYIAEVLNQFDLIALTELRDNLDDLQRVMARLGPNWEVVFSDFTMDAGGNRERIGYLFDTRMVQFTGLAAEADPPRRKSGNEYLPRFTWWRSPYMASFQAGSFDFVVLTAHMRWGNSTAARTGALAALHDWVVQRASDPHAVDQDFIVMGDFNIPKVGDALFNALTGNGKDLLMPPQLAGLPGSNLKRTARYDQILHRPTRRDRFSGAGGVVDFALGGWQALYPDPAERPKSAQAFTFQMSDHLPLWLQVRTDIVDDYLQKLARRKQSTGKQSGGKPA